MNQPYIVYIALLVVTLVSAFTDWRSGLIPNWLTYSTVVVAVAWHGSVGGFWGMTGSITGVIICGATPYLFYRMNAMGGGDVKLFAALGAIAGPGIGLEIQLLSLSLAFFSGLAVMAYRRQLLQKLSNTVTLMLNIVLPKARQKPVATDSLTPLRIGSAIFAATLLCIVDRVLLV